MRAAASLLATLAASAISCGDDGAPAPYRAPTTRARESSHARIDRLRSLGYLVFAEGNDAAGAARSGVVRHDRARTQPGYRWYNEQNRAAAVLIDADGRVLHRVEDVDGTYWARAELLPGGDVLAVGAANRGERRSEIEDEDRYVARFAWDGGLRWKRSIGAHHDVEVLSDGRILALVMEPRRIPAVDPDVDVRDDFVVELDGDGRERARHSIHDWLAGGPAAFAFGDVAAHLEATNAERRDGVRDYVDLLHTNSIDPIELPSLVGTSPLHRADSWLLTSRHQDTIAIVGAEGGGLRFAWGRGVLDGPHDASWLANGRLLVFDNGLGRNWSRVVEVDPQAREIVWEYRGSPPESFYTASRGSAQRLPNGNTLVSNSGEGQAFEITPEGEIVWEFWNPERNQKGRRATLGRMRWLDPRWVDPLLARDRSAPPL